MKKYVGAFLFCLTIFNAFSQASWVSFVISNTTCVGSSTNVIANSGTNVAIGYTWTALPSNSIISSPNNSLTTISFTPAGTYTIMLSADDGSTIATDSKTISVGPNLTSTGPTWTICPPPTSQGIIYLKAYGANTYTWTWSSGSFVGDSLNLYPYPSVSDTYYVTGRDINGCVSYTSQYVQVYPQIPIYVSTPALTCEGSVMCFTESAIGGLNFWVWNDGCGNSQSFGPYACFTASMACGNTFTVGGNNMNCMNYITFTANISPCTGIEKMETGSESYELFPNPIINDLKVKNASTENTTMQIEISDISARVVYRSTLSFIPDGIQTINLSELYPGIYFARIISNGQPSRSIKMLKE